MADEKEEVKEPAEETIEKITEEKVEEKQKEENNDIKEKKNKKPKNLVNLILIAILVIAVIALAIIDYPKIAKYVKNQRNPYGFDYNFNKVRSFDWDTLLTEKKIANALSVPIQKINSAKNPDYSWVLEEPKQFVDEIKCASLIDEKILDEVNTDNKNLFNINVMICKDLNETKNTYDSRKEEIKNIEKNDSTIKIQKMEDVKNIGEKGYVYLINKETATNDSESGTNQATSQKFAGIVFVRGPFMVMIDESEQQGMAVLSSDEVRNKLSSYIDKQLKRILAWY